MLLRLVRGVTLALLALVLVRGAPAQATGGVVPVEAAITGYGPGDYICPETTCLSLSVSLASGEKFALVRSPSWPARWAVFPFAVGDEAERLAQATAQALNGDGATLKMWAPALPAWYGELVERLRDGQTYLPLVVQR